MATDREAVWKELVDHVPKQVVSFFWADIHDDTDWNADAEALEQEFRPFAPQPAGKGRKVVDKLLKVCSKSGEVRYLHIEIQSYRERNFRWRMHTYNSRGENRYNQPVVTMPILIDMNRNWCPKRYRAVVHGTTRILTFRTIKILGYANRLDELEAHENPVGLFVCGYLEGRRLENDPEGKLAVKIRLLRRLKDHAMTVEEMGPWLGFFDWLLPLEKEYNARVMEALNPTDKEKIVPIVSYWEQVGIDKGIDKGEQRGLRKAIALGLKLRFGPDGVALAPSVEKIEELDLLRKLYDALDSESSLDDIRALLPAASNGPG